MVQRQARRICGCTLRFGVDSFVAMLQKYGHRYTSGWINDPASLSGQNVQEGIQ